ncbi:4Fe-4S dicluster domain-containing protein [Kordiimonas pumila]|uniref:4Fe-4S dicluster domain-containing protein n=1 Tax=Kordiimonas pumila TaxID=2161677 RepID=A0ABV7D6N7_9PROT|nr:4Fe-4S dicluster domain-containing protein [Kordiimonas pumila]
MKKWHLVVDVNLCTGCQNCVVATQDEYMNNDFKGYSKPGAAGVTPLSIEHRVRGTGSMVDAQHVPKMCNHCDDAPCIAASDGAIYKRPDGLVIIDPDKAVGRKNLVSTCPYGMIKWNDEQNVPQAWNFDAHLLDSGWKAPRAVQSCPIDALKALHISDSDMEKAIAVEKLVVLQPELNTKPRVYYKNLSAFLSHFIGGNVSGTRDGEAENIEGATIALLQNSTPLAETLTDAFGDFKFENLHDTSTGYSISINHPDYTSQIIEVSGILAESKVLDISLSR